ncbi:hypothetical protein PP175_28085 (plasmid) [Aneurinibacillus sp. Ricciae_BoGa-3]|uniref:hypothetical protein n=1 Tax=Aneurinibacillus sp. Ricciae_BoGa-3 TaxID=3022697 RepID=UPI00233F9883|nr:hypothetical protein [Aneurinibacillus sp. Ricciae_BoGa-3]WCK57051.1 hypothetical protein PP175_28085 [Aneurinibacillus sp. Ricciae_BoGa-3]
MKRQSKYLHKKEEWKNLYESGLSFTEIGKQEGVAYSTVQTVLRGVVTPRPKQQNARHVDEWVKLYTESEMSINAIGEKYGVTPNTVSKYLRKAGVELKKKGQTSPFEKEIPTWIELYKNGMSLKEIADKYNTYPQTIHKHIENKVDMREYAETSQTYKTENPHYLDHIDTHEKAYWLGVWFGTGFLSKSVNGFESTLALAYKDKETLERFREKIAFDKPISILQENETHIARLRILNKHMYEVLKSHGLAYEKNKNSVFPTQLKEKFYCSFLLGYYEGKGSCYTHSAVVRGYSYIQISLTFYGTELFLKELQRIVQKQIGVPLYLGEMRHNKNGRLWTVLRLATSKRESIEKMASWMYAHVDDFAKHRDIRKILSGTKRDV